VIRLITDYLIRLIGELKGSAENKIHTGNPQDFKKQWTGNHQGNPRFSLSPKEPLSGKFIARVGIGPKQFAKIIRFQHSHRNHRPGPGQTHRRGL
jgi:hypothetical protein